MLNEGSQKLAEGDHMIFICALENHVKWHCPNVKLGPKMDPWDKSQSHWPQKPLKGITNYQTDNAKFRVALKLKTMTSVRFLF